MRPAVDSALVPARSVGLVDVQRRRRARVAASQAALIVAGAGWALALACSSPRLATYALLAALATAACVSSSGGVVPLGRDPDGLVWPFVAVMLLGPLTLHYVVCSVVTLVSDGDLVNAKDFGDWIAMSGAIVGHAHVVGALLAARTARRIGAASLPAAQAGLGQRLGDRSEARRARSPSPGGDLEVRLLPILGWTVLASAIPGVLLLGLPPLFTAVTGLVLLLPLDQLRSRALSERSHIARGGRESVAGALSLSAGGPSGALALASAGGELTVVDHRDAGGA